MKKKKKKALKQQAAYRSWRNAWFSRIDNMSSLDGLAELIVASCDEPLKIDRMPSVLWNNSTLERSE